MIEAAPALDPEIQPTVCCGPYRINVREVIYIAILGAAEDQIVGGVRSAGSSAVADRYRDTLSYIPVASDVDYQRKIEISLSQYSIQAAVPASGIGDISRYEQPGGRPGFD